MSPGGHSLLQTVETATYAVQFWTIEHTNALSFVGLGLHGISRILARHVVPSHPSNYFPISNHYLHKAIFSKPLIDIRLSIVMMLFSSA